MVGCEMTVNDISIALKQKRNEAGLTQERVADKLHVSRQAVSNWETGRHLPDITLINQLAKLYGVSMDELVNQKRHDKVNQTGPLQNKLYSILIFVMLIVSRLEIASTSRDLITIDCLILLSVGLYVFTDMENVHIHLGILLICLAVFLICTFDASILNAFEFQTTTFMAGMVLLWQLVSTHHYQIKEYS